MQSGQAQGDLIRLHGLRKTYAGGRAPRVSHFASFIRLLSLNGLLDTAFPFGMMTLQFISIDFWNSSRLTFLWYQQAAVKNVWFAVPAGECFGFLGVNGAGVSRALAIACMKSPPPPTCLALPCPAENHDPEDADW